MLAKWLVTGAAGFFGANAGLVLSGRAHTLAQCRNRTYLPWFEDQVVLDLRDLDKVREAVDSFRPDVILHAAAISGHQTCADDPEQAIAVNVDASRVLSEAAAELGARIIYISTDAVFSGSTGSYKESDSPEPFSLYGETKLEGENRIRESGAEHIIVRTNFFGWSIPGNKSVLEFFVNSLRRSHTVEGFPDVVVTSVYVGSLLNSIWALAEADFSGTVHVASSDALSKYDFGQAIASQLGSYPSLIKLASGETQLPRSVRGRNLSLNTDLLCELLGERPQSQQEGIAVALAEETSIRERFGAKMI